MENKVKLIGEQILFPMKSIMGLPIELLTESLVGYRVGHLEDVLEVQITTPKGIQTANVGDYVCVDEKGKISVNSKVFTEKYIDLIQISEKSLEDGKYFTSQINNLLNIATKITKALGSPVIIGGSLALYLHGIQMNRMPSDLDIKIVLPPISSDLMSERKLKIYKILKKYSSFFKSHHEKSASDFNLCLKHKKTPIDIKIIDEGVEEAYTTVDRYGYTVTPIWDVIQWKYKYAQWDDKQLLFVGDSMKKHRNDLIHIFGEDAYHSQMTAKKTLSPEIKESTHVMLSKKLIHTLEVQFDVKKSIESQKKYCLQKKTPVFSPPDGSCYRCHRNIFKPRLFLNDNGDLLSFTGIKTETASTKLITGCPHCHRSYVD